MLTPNQLRLRLRQCLLSVALITPLVAAIVTAPPFAAETRAQSAAHMLGPAFPVLAGSDNIVPTRSGNSVTIPTRWSCSGAASSVIALSNPSGGRFMTMSRTNGPLQQSATITSVVSGAPAQFSYAQLRGSSSTATGTIALRDANLDGVPDSLSFSGTVSGSISFAFTPDSNYVSIPWAEASALGVDTTPDCGGAVPQVWVPLADTNGDGKGDAIVLDLDGNGVADPDLFAGPSIVVPSVPAMSPFARLILMMLVGSIGAWFLSRRSNSAGRPEAV
jgi:hypothetical protein